MGKIASTRILQLIIAIGLTDLGYQLYLLKTNKTLSRKFTETMPSRIPIFSISSYLAAHAAGTIGMKIGSFFQNPESTRKATSIAGVCLGTFAGASIGHAEYTWVSPVTLGTLLAGWDVLLRQPFIHA